MIIMHVEDYEISKVSTTLVCDETLVVLHIKPSTYGVSEVFLSKEELEQMLLLIKQKEKPREKI